MNKNEINILSTDITEETGVEISCINAANKYTEAEDFLFREIENIKNGNKPITQELQIKLKNFVDASKEKMRINAAVHRQEVDFKLTNTVNKVIDYLSETDIIDNIILSAKNARDLKECIASLVMLEGLIKRNRETIIMKDEEDVTRPLNFNLTYENMTLNVAVVKS